MNWRVIWAIARKDIVDAVKNSYILFGLLLPVGLSLLFRIAFPNSDQLLSLNISVYDPGNSKLVTALRGMPDVQLRNVTSADQLSGDVEKNAVGGLAVPAGFDDAVKSGAKPELTVYVNQRHGGGEIAAFKLLVEHQVWALVGQEAPAQIRWTGVNAPPGTLQGNFNFENYLLIMFLVMSLAMAGAFTVPSLLVEEKEKHTLQALLVSPATHAEVVIGKAVTGMVYSLLTAGVLIALNHGWSGDWYITALALVLGAMFCVAMGLLMGALFRTTQQVNTWSSIVMLLLMLPSWFGIFGSVLALDVFTHLIPTQYLVDALGPALAGEASLPNVGLPLTILAASVLAAYAVVVWRLRQEET